MWPYRRKRSTSTAFLDLSRWIDSLVKEKKTHSSTPPSPLLAVPNITARPSTASVPITVFLYDGPLLCGFNVTIKGLNLTELVPHGSYCV